MVSRKPKTEIPVSITLLKTLIAVSEQGSFSAAADYVGVSHAAVGQQMKRLESSLQIALFDRTKTPPKLNQLGNALIPKARNIVHSYETMLDDLPGSSEWVGELTLGAVQSTIRGLVPLAIKALKQHAKGLHVRVVPGLSNDLSEQVERGAIDAAILSKPSRVSRSLSWKAFVEEELVLLTSPEVTESDPIRLLQDMPYIKHTRRASVGEISEDWLSENNIAPAVSMEMESLESVASMVYYGLGVSVVPNVCVPDPIFARLRKLPLYAPEHHRILGVLTRQDCPKTALVSGLLLAISEVIIQQGNAQKPELAS